MVQEGARVKLRAASRLAVQHPELADAVGVVGSVMHGAAWARLGATGINRVRDVTAHVRFREMNLVALNVSAADLEPVDRLNPETLDAG